MAPCLWQLARILKKPMLGMSVILFGLSCFTAQAAVLKIASIAPDGGLWMTKMRSAAEQIAKQTEGRVKFKFYPGGVMGNHQSVLRKMRFGQLQGGAFTAGNLAEVYPDVHIYALPFLMNEREQVDYVRQRMDPTLLDGLKQKGLISFGFAGAGFAYTMSEMPVRTLADFRKHKVWAPTGDQFSSLILKNAGISPVPLPLPDVLTGLQTGLIDIVTVTPVGAIAFQWYTKLAYINDTPVSYIYGLLALDKKAFNKIKPKDQAIVQEVLTRVNAELDHHSWIDQEQALEALLKQGVTLTDTNPDLLNEWLGYAHKTIEQLGQQGAYSESIYQQLKHYLECYRLKDNSCQ